MYEHTIISSECKLGLLDREIRATGVPGFLGTTKKGNILKFSFEEEPSDNWKDIIDAVASSHSPMEDFYDKADLYENGVSSSEELVLSDTLIDYVQFETPLLENGKYVVEYSGMCATAGVGRVFNAKLSVNNEEISEAHASGRNINTTLPFGGKTYIVSAIPKKYNVLLQCRRSEGSGTVSIKSASISIRQLAE